MSKQNKIDLKTKITIILFGIFGLFWLYNFVFIPKTDIKYQIFSAVYGLIAIYGGINGLLIARKWGGNKSLIGKALIYFSLGLFAQEFGQLTYSFYAYYLHIEIPYPSIGDIGYFGSIPLYFLGLINLARASGVHLVLKSYTNKIQAILIPLILLFLSYVLFLSNYHFDWTSPLTILLDFGYPMGQAIYISLAILIYLLTRRQLGGLMKPKVLLLLFALFIQYLSDYTYIYLAHKNVVYVGGPNDFLYLMAYFFMSIALLQFDSLFNEVKK